MNEIEKQNITMEDVPDCCNDCKLCNENKNECEWSGRNILLNIKSNSRAYMCPAYWSAIENERKQKSEVII